MIPTLFDLRTGRTAKGSDESVFWWTEGNGACDCNRCLAFGIEVLDEYEKSHAEDVCFGHKRFIAIDVEGDFDYDYDSKEQLLVAMNAGYGK